MSEYEDWLHELDQPFPAERERIAKLIRAAYEAGLSSINGDACFEYDAADAILALSSPDRTENTEQD